MQKENGFLYIMSENWGRIRDLEI